MITNKKKTIEIVQLTKLIMKIIVFYYSSLSSNTIRSHLIAINNHTGWGKLPFPIIEFSYNITFIRKSLYNIIFNDIL